MKLVLSFFHFRRSTEVAQSLSPPSCVAEGFAAVTASAGGFEIYGGCICKGTLFAL